MVFTTGFRCISKFFLLVCLVTAVNGFGADQQVLPTMAQCINGGHTLISTGYKGDCKNFNDLICDNANLRDTARVNLTHIHKNLTDTNIYMKASLIQVMPSAPKSKEDLKNLANTSRDQLTQQLSGDHQYLVPQLDAVWELNAVHKNINFAQIFYALGGYGAVEAVLNGLAACNSTMDNSTTGGGCEKR